MAIKSRVRSRPSRKTLMKPTVKDLSEMYPERFRPAILSAWATAGGNPDRFEQELVLATWDHPRLPVRIISDWFRYLAR